MMKTLKYLLSLLLVSNCVSSYAQTPYFGFNGGADVNFSYPPRGSGGRALVHADANILALNFGGDFTGGTRIGNGLLVGNDGTLTVPDGKPYFGSVFQTNGYSTMIFASRAWQTVQGANGKAFSFLTHTDAGNYGFEVMAIHYGENGKIIMAHNGGNVGIGTDDPKGYKLAVAGSMITESVRVKLHNTWPDYVFEKDYKLPSLIETEKYIKEKGHLPGIPSASDVKANGIELGEMNAKLLQKIEELTLHLIDSEKRNGLLGKEVQELKQINNKILEVLNLKHEK